MVLINRFLKFLGLKKEPVVEHVYYSAEFNAIIIDFTEPRYVKNTGNLTYLGPL